ncbi:MAG TPA: hypothetical protein VGO70_07705 [Arsenicitalea sp.]|jgi:hypothetical protein|nr:hypothetical protein [Arsenicitalea sp.]
MAALNEVARLKRDVKTLVEAVNMDLRPNAKVAMTVSDRRNIKSEIENCMRELDELRNRLGG